MVSTFTYHANARTERMRIRDICTNISPCGKHIYLSGYQASVRTERMRIRDICRQEGKKKEKTIRGPGLLSILGGRD